MKEVASMKNQDKLKELILNNHKHQNAYFRVEKRKKYEIKITENQTYLIKNGIEEGGNVLLDLEKKSNLYCFTDITDDLLNEIQTAARSRNLKKSLITLNTHTGSFCMIEEKSKYIEIEALIEQLRDYINFIKNIDDSIVDVWCQYKEEYIEKQFFNNVGMDVIYDNFDIAFFIKVTFCINHSLFIDTFYDGSSYDRNIVIGRQEDLRKFICKVLSILKLKCYKMAARSFNHIILDQSVAGTFVHEVVGHLSEADNTENFNSVRRGEILSGAYVSVCDESLPEARGYIKFDDEGTLTEKQVIIDRGRLIGRMNTIKTGIYYGERACGNARSISFMHAPLCRMRHTSLSDGEFNLQDILSSCDSGLYLIGSRGGSSGVNFSISSRYGIMIEKGKKVGVIYNPYLQGNVFQALKGIKYVCNDKLTMNFYNGCGRDDQYPLPVSFSSPSLYLEGGFYH